MTDNEKQFEDFVRQIKFDDTPDPSHRDKLEQNLLSALTKQTPRQIKIWRTIMKSSITKLATAAVIILVVALGITLLEKSTTPAWAIEQTIEALERFNAVHITGTSYAEDGSEFRYNLWAKPNEDRTQSGDFRLEMEDGQIRWVQDNDTYHYDPNENTVRITRGQKASINPWIGRDLLQTLEQTTDDWQVLYGKDPASGRDRAFVTCSYQNSRFSRSWWFEFDLETKLLVSFKQWHNLYRQGKPNFDAQRIIYYEDLPDEVFEFENPEGAEVIEQTWDWLNDPNSGMLAEGMTQDEASVEIVRQYWQAVIEGNWDLVENIRPVANAEDWERKYSIYPPEEIVEIGEPYQQAGCSIGPVTPLIIKLQDGATKEIKMIIKFRDINGESSCVIAGTWGKE